MIIFLIYVEKIVFKSKCRLRIKINYMIIMWLFLKYVNRVLWSKLLFNSRKLMFDVKSLM